MFYSIVTIQITATTITGRAVYHLSLENVSPHIILSKKISVCLYKKGWQFSCHIITSRRVKDLLLENVYNILFNTKVYTKRGGSLADRSKCLGFITGKCFTLDCLSMKTEVNLYKKG